MSKFISIPIVGVAATSAVTTPGAVTVSGGAVTAVALGTAGLASQFAPTIVLTPSDGQGSGAIVTPVVTTGTISSYAVTSGGSGYSGATVTATAVYPPFLLNAEKVISVSYTAQGSSLPNQNTLVIKMDTVTTPTLTLTFNNGTATAPTDGNFNLRNIVESAIMFANNVKNVDQITPVVLPSGIYLSTATFS